MRLFKHTLSTFARTQYGALEVINRFSTVFVLLIMPFFVLRHTYWLVELFLGLYIIFRISFCSACHQQIMDALVKRLKKLGKTPVNQVIKMIVVLLVLFIGGFVLILTATHNSIRSFGLEKSEMTFFYFIILYCYAVPEITMYITYIYQGKLND